MSPSKSRGDSIHLFTRPLSHLVGGLDAVPHETAHGDVLPSIVRLLDHPGSWAIAWGLSRTVNLLEGCRDEVVTASRNELIVITDRVLVSFRYANANHEGLRSPGVLSELVSMDEDTAVPTC